MNVFSSFFIILILAIALVAGGAFLGFYYQKQVCSPGSGLAGVGSYPTVLMFRARTIDSITAFGGIKSIDGKTILLSAGEDDPSPLSITIKDDAPIYMRSAAAGSFSAKKAEFKDIKVGNEANITISVSEAGKLEGTSVMIIP